MLARLLVGSITVISGLLTAAAAGDRPEITYPRSDTILYGLQPICVEGVPDPRAMTVRILGPEGAVRGVGRATGTDRCELDFGGSLSSFRVQATVAWQDGQGRYQKRSSPVVLTGTARPPSAEAALHEAVVSLSPEQIERARRRMFELCEESRHTNVGEGASKRCDQPRLDDPRWYDGTFGGAPVKIREVRLGGGSDRRPVHRESLVLLDVSSSVPHARAARTALIEHFGSLRPGPDPLTGASRRRFAVMGFDETIVGSRRARFVGPGRAIGRVRRLDLVRRTSGSRICRAWRHGMELASRRRQVLDGAGVDADVDVIILSDFWDVRPRDERPRLGPEYDRPVCRDLMSRAGSYGVATYALPIRFGGRANFGYDTVAERSGGSVHKARTYGRALAEVERSRQLRVQFEVLSTREEGELVLHSSLFSTDDPLYEAARRLGRPVPGRAYDELARAIVAARRDHADVRSPFATRRFHNAVYQLTNQALIQDPLRAAEGGLDAKAVARQATRYARVLRDVVFPTDRDDLLRELRPLLALAQLKQFPLADETKGLLRDVHSPAEPSCADIYH